MLTKSCPYCAEEIQDQAIKCKHCGSWLVVQPGQSAGQQAAGFAGPTEVGSGRRLVRPTADRVLAGVCSGVAHYLGLDPTVIRIVYALTTFFTLGLPGIFIYFLLTLIIPSDTSVAA